MTTTPKWYCRNKSQPMHTFAEIGKLGQELRRITKRIVIDVKVDIFNEHDTILEECERIVDEYWSLKDLSKNKDFLTLAKKIKRSPYNALLLRKYKCLIELNDRRFCQLTFVLKKTLSYLLRKSTQSEIWLNWALQITHLYNKCRLKTPAQLPSPIDGEEDDANPELSEAKERDKEVENEMNANVCSNLFPALLLPPKAIDFSYVLQLVSQTRIEQNALDLMFGLFNMGEQDAWHENCESTASSLEILRILTLNIAGDGEFQQYYEPQRDYGALPLTVSGSEGALSRGLGQEPHHSLRSKHTEYFLQKERDFITQLIARAGAVCPTIFGGGGGTSASTIDLNAFIVRGMHLIWSYVGIILDHIILWWIDTPISCYSLAHIDSIRNWLYAQSVKDIPEPVYSTLRGIGEILTNFVCNNIWDQLFRLTLISSTSSRSTVDSAVAQYRGMPENLLGTPTGTVWITVFANLINLSNNYFPHNDVQSSSSQQPVSEQIPILHRIVGRADHSVHSMRLWVKDQAKLLCAEWHMDRFFQILEHDVRICLGVFASIKLPKLTADLTDILMLVCVALRTKLICEVNVNIDKLKKTTDECVQTLSAVCRVLSLANFTLSFPDGHHWQQANYADDQPQSDYVGYVLDHIYLPTIRATHDMVILKLILKIICEAWLDYIYQKRIKFSVNGALQLLNDFDKVREWILACTLLDQDYIKKLSQHEVLRMCKGVGKILLRKPEDIIAITHSPKFDRRRRRSGENADDAAMEETQLPSEMFVSNQKHWLQLRASKSSFPFLGLCCGDA